MESSLYCVLILPMRNGNNIDIKLSYVANRVLILPMRNGNDGEAKIGMNWAETRPYPTYEEWKLFVN